MTALHFGNKEHPVSASLANNLPKDAMGSLHLFSL